MAAWEGPGRGRSWRRMESWEAPEPLGLPAAEGGLGAGPTFPARPWPRPSRQGGLAPRQRAAESRMREAAYLASLGSAFPMSTDAEGALLQPLEAGGWTVLVSLGTRFPAPCADGTPAAKAYLVDPCERDLPLDAARSRRGPWRLGRDGEGNAYISAAPGARRWGETASEALVRVVEAASRALGSPQAACSRVALSSRAYAQIWTETMARDPDETGGLLLGHYEGGVWTVVEASDPGWEGRALFRRAYHEGDERYENHACAVASRAYRHPLVFLGMWHRHPGSMDTFSSIDDATNLKYADACGNGCVSALVNIDPELRLTFYHARRTGAGGVAYSRVPVDIGDEHVPNPEVLLAATPDDLAARTRRAGRPMDDI